MFTIASPNLKSQSTYLKAKSSIQIQTWHIEWTLFLEEVFNDVGWVLKAFGNVPRSTPMNINDVFE